MDPIPGPDRSPEIEAFLMGELRARMRRVRALRRLERRNGGWTLDQADAFLVAQKEEHDIARVLLWWRGGVQGEGDALRVSYERLFAATLIMRFAAGPGQKVRWPTGLKRQFASYDLEAFLMDTQIDGSFALADANRVAGWYWGMAALTARSAQAAGECMAWCLESVTWLVTERERLLLEHAPTDPPPA